MTEASIAAAAPDPTPAARAFFGDRLDRMEAFAALLAGPATERGLLGPREVPRLWDRHLLNCAVVSELVPAGASACDVGSGAGLPGIVLALLRPDAEVALVEPLLRRCVFLQEAVASLDLPNVEVIRSRAEDLAGIRHFSVVTARAVAPLDRLAAWGLPLVAAGGTLLALKGSSATEELERHRSELLRLGARRLEVFEVGAGVLEETTWVVALGVDSPVRAPRPRPERTSRRSPRSIHRTPRRRG